MKQQRSSREAAEKWKISRNVEMPKKQYRKNPILELPLVGPTEAAEIFGWRSARSWKSHLSEMPEIRRVRLLRGTFYVLEDVLRARYPELSKPEIESKVSEHVEIRRSNHQPRREWIGPSECARLCGWKSPSTWKRHLSDFPRIRQKKNGSGRLYDLGDVFAAIYPEANQERLNDMIVDYRLIRAKQRLERGENARLS